MFPSQLIFQTNKKYQLILYLHNIQFQLMQKLSNSLRDSQTISRPLFQKPLLKYLIHISLEKVVDPSPTPDPVSNDVTDRKRKNEVDAEPGCSKTSFFISPKTIYTLSRGGFKVRRTSV